MDITTTVYDGLKEATKEIQKVASAKNNLEDRVKNNRYSAEVVKREIKPRIDDLKQEIESMREQAVASARALVNNYRLEVDAKNNLDPAEITDDIKLLSCGLPLTERDIETIIKRNEGNRTMTLLSLRYAAQHDLKIKDRPHIFELEQKRAKETADALDQILVYYPKWIDTDKGLDMLDRFFNVK